MRFPRGAVLLWLALPRVTRATQCIYVPIQNDQFDSVQCRVRELGRLTAFPTNETVYDATGHSLWPSSLPGGIAGMRQFAGQLSFASHDIADITETSFEHVPYASIRGLSLNQNVHERIGRRSFRKFGPTLIRLSLNDNKITYIASGAFVDLTQLALLRLESNRIEAFDYGVFATFPRLCVAGTDPVYYENRVYGPGWALAQNPFDDERDTYDAGCFTRQTNALCFANIAPPIGTMEDGFHFMCQLVQSGECGRSCPDGAVACLYNESSPRAALAEPPVWCVPGAVVVEDADDSTGLSAGAIAGIAVGAVAFVAVVGVALL
jgi:hypothetical protein